MLRLVDRLLLFKSFLRLTSLLCLLLLHVKCHCENPDVLYKQARTNIPKNKQQNQPQHEEGTDDLAALLQALRDGKELPVPASSTTTTTTATASTSTSGDGAQHKDARLQVRLSSGGQPIVVTLPSESSTSFLQTCYSCLRMLTAWIP